MGGKRRYTKEQVDGVLNAARVATLKARLARLKGEVNKGREVCADSEREGKAQRSAGSADRTEKAEAKATYTRARGSSDASGNRDLA